MEDIKPTIPPSGNSVLDDSDEVKVVVNSAGALEQDRRYVSSPFAISILREVLKQAVRLSGVCLHGRLWWFLGDRQALYKQIERQMRPFDSSEMEKIMYVIDSGGAFYLFEG